MALQDQHWSPSHVQVTVLRARELRAKSKHGTSDAFAIIQLGKDKYCTSVLEKSLQPEWKEECTFEVMPGWVEQPQQQGRELLLTIMHRSLLGMDKFLGQLSLPLATLYQDKNSRKPAWYKLCSKPGQTEKQRGEIQVSVQFVRNNLTASMFDLSSKEKHRSALGKLKDKMKGRKKHDGLMAESASAIVPSSVGQIYSDEEFSEKETPEKKSKKGFFSKPKLHRSSLTKSNTSLSSQQSVKSLESVSSSNGAETVSSPKTTVAPTGFQPPLISKTIDGTPSLPKIMTHKRALSDEVGQTNVIDTKGLAPKSSPLSRSSLCINGSHVYSEEPPSKTSSSLFPASSSLSRSLQDIANKAEESPRPAPNQEPEGWRWPASSSEKVETRLVPPVITVDDEDSASVPAAGGQRQEEVGSAWGAKPVHAAVPIISTVEPTKKNAPDETKKASIFPFGSDSKDSETRRSRTPSPVRKSSSLAERSKNSGWFLKDANHKPSLEVSPLVETSSDAPSFSPCLLLHPPPPVPLLPPSRHPFTHPGSLGSTTNTNPFTTAEEALVPSSKPTTNPFFSALQSNPFFQDLLADQVLKSPPFTSSFSSLSFGSRGIPDVSAPCPSTAESNGSDSFALAKPTAEEEIRARPRAPASATTATDVSAFQRPEPSTPSGPLVASDAATWSAVFPSTGPDAEVKGQSPSEPTDAVSLGDLKVAVPSIVPRQMKMESRMEGEYSSIVTQAVDHKNVEMGPSIPTPNTAPIQARTQRSSISVNFSRPKANSKVNDDEPLDMIQEITTTENTKPLDLKTCSVQDTTVSPAPDSLPQAEGDGSPEIIPNAVFSKEGCGIVPEIRTGPEPQTNHGSLAMHQEEIPKKQNDLGNMERSSAPVEGSSGTSGIADKAEGWWHVRNFPLLTSAPEVTADGTIHAKNGNGCIVPLFQDTEDNVQGDVCLVSPSGSQATMASNSQDIDMPCEGAGRSPESIADEKSIISEPLDKLDIQFTQTGPPPPKPPRLLVCADLALGEEVSLVAEEKQREEAMPLGQPVRAPQLVNLSEQQLDQRFEQQASLVVSVDEANPDRTNSISAQSAAKEPEDNIRPSNDVVTKGEASCGTIELSVNERTGVEHYKTCLSTLSVEGINTSVDDDGNSNKLDVFQQVLSSGLIEVHQAKQLVESQPALLKTTAGVNSLETASQVEERLTTVPERQIVLWKEETGLPGPDQADQSELDFMSAVEELSHKSSPMLLECAMSLGSGEEFSGKLGAEMSEDAGRVAGAYTLRDCEETLTRSTETETQGSQPADQGAGAGPFQRMETERLARGEGATPADHLPSGFHPPLTETSDQGPGLGKAVGTPCHHQPSVQHVDLQSVGSKEPVRGDSPLAAPPGHYAANDSFFEKGLSFKDLHLKAAPHALRATNLTGEQLAQPPLGNKPLAFSTPYPVAVTNSRVTDLPSPILFPSNVAPQSATTQAAVASHHSLPSSGSKVPVPFTVLPRETQPAETPFPPQTISPHPVKPISTTVPEITEKKSGRSSIGSTLSSGLEKLKNATTGSISPIRSPAPARVEQEAVKESKPADPVARYYHLTHDELIQKILQQELELQKKEVHVRDLEDYIDLLLVQIMEQKPGILQSVSQMMKNKTASK